MAVRLDGLAEFRAALRALPADLAAEAAAVVAATVAATEQEMRGAYPVRDYGLLADRGALVKGLKSEVHADGAGAVGSVRNVAKHAYIFEHGTGPRRWANGKSTGSMPPGRVFIPIAQRRRRAMYDALIAILHRAGFTVSGGI